MEGTTQIAQVNTLSADPRHATKLLSRLAGNWQMAMDLLGLMHAWRKTVNTFHLGSALNACQKATQWLLATDLLWNGQFLCEETFTSVVCCSSVISSCGNAGQWKTALLLLGLMRCVACEPNLVSLNSGASSCERHGLWRHASSLLDFPRPYTQGCILGTEPENLRKNQEGIRCGIFETQGIQVDTISFNSLISNCEKAGEWERAFNVLQVMSTFTILYSLISFSAAVSACEKAEQWNWALQVFRTFGTCQSLSSLSSLSSRLSRFHGFPHLHFCNALVSACGKGRKWRLVGILLEQMAVLRIGPDTVTFNAALYSYDHLQWKSAVDLLAQMTFAEVEKNDITFNAACASARYNWLSILRLLCNMKSAKLQDDALTQSALVSSLVSGLTAKGEKRLGNRLGNRLAAVLREVGTVWMDRVRPKELDQAMEACDRQKMQMHCKCSHSEHWTVGLPNGVISIECNLQAASG